jgi:hypothetical protein
MSEFWTKYLLWIWRGRMANWNAFSMSIVSNIYALRNIQRCNCIMLNNNSRSDCESP